MMAITCPAHLQRSEAVYKICSINICKEKLLSLKKETPSIEKLMVKEIWLIKAMIMVILCIDRKDRMVEYPNKAISMKKKCNKDLLNR